MGSGDITIAGRILFTQGLMVNVIRCRMVSVIQDNLLEASENFNIFVSDVTANVGGVPDVSITDNVLLPTANATLTVPSSDTGCKLVGVKIKCLMLGMHFCYQFHDAVAS